MYPGRPIPRDLGKCDRETIQAATARQGWSPVQIHNYLRTLDEVPYCLDCGRRVSRLALDSDSIHRACGYEVEWREPAHI